MVLTLLSQSAACCRLLGSTFHDVLRVAPQVLRQKVHEAAAVGIEGRLRAACKAAPQVRAVGAEGAASARRRALKAVAAAALATKVVAVQIGATVSQTVAEGVGAHGQVAARHAARRMAAPLDAKAQARLTTAPVVLFRTVDDTVEEAVKAPRPHLELELVAIGPI